MLFNIPPPYRQCTLIECKAMIDDTHRQLQKLLLADYTKDAPLKLHVMRLKEHLMEALVTFSKLQRVRKSN